MEQLIKSLHSPDRNLAERWSVSSVLQNLLWGWQADKVFGLTVEVYLRIGK